MKVCNKLKQWLGYIGTITAIAQIARFLIGLGIALASMKWDVLIQFFRDSFNG